MSLLGFSVDWNEVKDVGFKALPAGVYAAKVTKAEVGTTKKGDGRYIKVELTLMGQKGIAGRKMFDYLLIKHPNENVVQGALRKFKKLAEAKELNPDDIQDTSELQGAMVSVKLKVETSEQYGEQNKVQDYQVFDEDLLNKSLDSAPF